MQKHDNNPRMTSLIPSFNSCQHKMQPGERRFAQRLESFLEDDYACWYEIGVGKRPRYADFIILHPSRGLLLLEVKDWKLETIQKIDKNSATIFTSSGCKVVSNPLEQARQCVYQLVNTLERDAQLIQHTGRYQGKLAFPYGYGVVLTNITRKQFEAQRLNEVLPEYRVLCKDEMLESTDPEAFQACLWQMLDYSFQNTLSLPQIDRIRWHLFPEIRISKATPQADLFAPPTPQPDTATLLPDIMQVMDWQQEQLARSLGTGHRVIHGVAGSGKTLILAYRCEYLAQLPIKPILVLCYNIALAARLRSLMQEKKLHDRVNVYHFHDWCGEQLRTYQVDRPTEQGSEYVTALVQAVINAVAKQRIPREQYGAILIDEGHDFEPSWLQLISGMVDSDSDSLLLLYDDAQSIYRHKDRLNFSLSSVGIQARGRTTILKLNYRNTEEILTVAYRFAQHYFQPQTCDEDHVPLIEPQAVGRHGQMPVLRCFASFSLEVQKITQWLQHWHAQGTPWQAMCIIYRHYEQGKSLHQALQQAKLPCQWLVNTQSKKQFDPQHASIKLMTMHSSKGLEFPLVVIAGLGFMPEQQQEEVAEAKLLYVAMTRSTDKLLLTTHRQTRFTAFLAESCAV